MNCTLRFLAVLMAIGLCWAAPTAASAKSKGKSCAKAELALLETGKGDRDGDGLSDCRERRQLGTSIDSADTDEDGLSDPEEIANGSDPLDHDSDDDGIEDGDDDTPGMPEQKVEAFLDALTCPQLGVLGSITALGVTATVNEFTEFDDATCEEVAALLVPGETGPFVEIKILEDATGALSAREVQLEDHDGGDED
jgi:Bacterial TSP3 repeat/Domain of unknown function (DUF5666)